MVLSCVKFPRVTPPVVPVVQSVIGPLVVPISLGDAALAPALPVIRPADLTRMPPVPADMLPFKEVVEVPRASAETLLPAEVVAPIVMFPAEERETFA